MIPFTADLPAWADNSLVACVLVVPRILDILILQDKTLFGALEASNIVCWLVNQPIAKLDLFKSPDCRWICETYVEYCYRNSATVRRLVQSPTLQSTISCGVHSDSRGKGIRVSPAWLYGEPSQASKATWILPWLFTGDVYVSRSYARTLSSITNSNRAENHW